MVTPALHAKTQTQGVSEFAGPRPRPRVSASLLVPPPGDRDPCSSCQDPDPGCQRVCWSQTQTQGVSEFAGPPPPQGIVTPALHAKTQTQGVSEFAGPRPRPRVSASLLVPNPDPGCQRVCWSPRDPCSSCQDPDPGCQRVCWSQTQTQGVSEFAGPRPRPRVSASLLVPDPDPGCQRVCWSQTQGVSEFAGPRPRPRVSASLLVPPPQIDDWIRR